VPARFSHFEGSVPGLQMAAFLLALTWKRGRAREGERSLVPVLTMTLINPFEFGTHSSVHSSFYM
jgi:hypothetical protein